MGRGRGRLWATAGEPLRQEEEDVRHAIASVKIHIGEAVGLGRGRGSGACGQRGGSEPEGQAAPLGGVGVGPVGMRITRSSRARRAAVPNGPDLIPPLLATRTSGGPLSWRMGQETPSSLNTMFTQSGQLVHSDVHSPQE